jgi:hypothetical protein
LDTDIGETPAWAATACIVTALLDRLDVGRLLMVSPLGALLV